MHPMIRALGRHKVPVTLLIIEVALVCGVVANALHLLDQYAARTNTVTGMTRGNLAWLQTSGTGRQGSSVEEDLQTLRHTGGVSNAAVVSALPLTGTSAYAIKVSTELAGKGAQSVGLYFWGQGSVPTTGVKLNAGRDFHTDEYVDYTFFGSNPPPSVALVTQALAARLFDGKDAVGQRIHLLMPGDPYVTVVGVMEDLVSPSPRFKGEDHYNIVLPVTKVPGGIYALRITDDGGLARAADALYAADPSRVITRSERFSDTEGNYFRGAKSMVYTLASLIGCLVLLLVVGTVAISNYWILQRHKAIGIRRAVGATKGSILRYFLAENACLMGCGAIIGALVAMGVNVWLMKFFEVDRLPLTWVPVGLLSVMSIGLLAVIYPAIKASRINISAISATD